MIDSRIFAAYGDIHIDSSNPLLRREVSFLVVQEDTVITVLKDSLGNDLLAEKQLSSGPTLKAGRLIGPSKTGRQIAAVTVTSGSIAGYYSKTKESDY